MSDNFLASVLKCIDPATGDDEGCVITTYLNPYSYLVLRKCRSDLADINRVHCDGILLSILMRLAGIQTPRCSFDMTSMARKVFSEAEISGRKLYLVGGEPGIATCAAESIQADYPELLITGAESGFFDDAEHRQRVKAAIVEAAPDICVVGMGTPLQENFLIELKQAGWKGKGYTCGGFFHQTAKAGTAYYPNWMNRLHLRWLYRIIDEPKLIRRYFIFYPFFLGVFLKDLVILRFLSGR